jgi:hypothetical protein
MDWPHKRHWSCVEWRGDRDSETGNQCGNMHVNMNVNMDTHDSSQQTFKALPQGNAQGLAATRQDASAARH